MVKVTGSLSYHVQLSSGEVVRCHADAVHSRHTTFQPEQSQQATDDTTENDIFLPNLPPTHPTPVHPPPPPQVSIRRSTCSRTAPDRFVLVKVYEGCGKGVYTELTVCMCYVYGY